MKSINDFTNRDMIDFINKVNEVGVYYAFKSSKGSFYFDGMSVEPSEMTRASEIVLYGMDDILFAFRNIFCNSYDDVSEYCELAGDCFDRELFRRATEDLMSGADKLQIMCDMDDDLISAINKHGDKALELMV